MSPSPTLGRSPGEERLHNWTGLTPCLDDTCTVLFCETISLLSIVMGCLTVCVQQENEVF